MEVNDDSSSIWLQKFWKTNGQICGDCSIGQHWQHAEDRGIHHRDNSGRFLTENYLIFTIHPECLDAKRQNVNMKINL